METPFGEIPDRLVHIADDLHDMLGRLSKNDLLTINTAFEMVAQASSNPLAANLHGIASTYLKLRFNVCADHGVNHELEAMNNLRMLDGKEAVADEEVKLDSLREDEPVVKDAVEVSPDQGVLFDMAADPMANFRQNLKVWDMRLKNESDPTGPVICNGCDTEYVNLMDRMLRQPGPAGCSPCQRIAMYGGGPARG